MRGGFRRFGQMGPPRGNDRPGADEEEVPEGPKIGLMDTRSLLIPYFWPTATKDRIRAMSCFLLLGVSRACNLLSPLYLGQATGMLALSPPQMPLEPVILYAGLQLLSTICSEMQNYVYLGVKEIAYVEVAANTFQHLHSLSLNWHLSKKTGAALRSMDRGIRSANTIVSFLFLRLGPSIIEWLIVIAIMMFKYHAYMVALVAFVSFILYFALTYILSAWRKRIRAKMNQQDNNANDRAVDSLTNFETVKYFTNESYELQRYRRAVELFQLHTRQTGLSLHVLNITQEAVMRVATMIVLLISGARVVNGEATIGEFVAMNAYIMQLFSPLSWLGTIFNMLVDAVEDMKNLAQLLKLDPDVQDAPGAQPLVITNHADVEFRNVVFHYPSKPADTGLRGISFSIPAGKTVAFVGHTGAGKSTIARLLFRFYDLTDGQILINGQDIAQVTQKSLRAQIGIVPQDTVLFNDTIRYNIEYGKVGSSQEEIDQAAANAQLKAFIGTLEKGYETPGGEKQRVAIARTLLKNPPILVLDEATSALDTITEQEIQAALHRVRDGRTVLVIAHRLSTVRDADEIIVLSQGQILERGTHEQLLEMRGNYAAMWDRQVQDSKASPTGPEEPAADAKAAPPPNLI